MFICLNFKNLHKEIPVVFEKFGGNWSFGSEEVKKCEKLPNNRQTNEHIYRHTVTQIQYTLWLKKTSLQPSTQSEVIKRIVPKSCTYRSNRPGDHHVCYIFDKLLGIRRQRSLNSKLVLLWRDRNHRVCQLPTEGAPVLPFIDSQVPGHFLCL